MSHDNHTHYIYTVCVCACSPPLTQQALEQIQVSVWSSHRSITQTTLFATDLIKSFIPAVIKLTKILIVFVCFFFFYKWTEMKRHECPQKPKQIGCAFSGTRQISCTCNTLFSRGFTLRRIDAELCALRLAEPVSHSNSCHVRVEGDYKPAVLHG